MGMTTGYSPAAKLPSEMIVTLLPFASTASTSISGEPIMTSRCTTERFDGRRAGGAAVAEAEAEGDVRGGVLVEQRREVRPAGRADARGAVDERELAEARRAAVAREVAGEELAIALVVGLDAHQPPALELARDALDHAARERERPRAAELPGRRRLVGAREDLFGGDVRRDAVAAHVVDAAAPARAGRERQAQVGAGRGQADLAQVERGEPLGARGEVLGVPPPAVGRVVGAEPREAQQVVAERRDGGVALELGIDLRGPGRASARRRRRSARRRGRRRAGRAAGPRDR